MTVVPRDRTARALAHVKDLPNLSWTMDGIDDEDCAELKFGPGSSPFDHFHARALECLRMLYCVLAQKART